MHSAFTGALQCAFTVCIHSVNLQCDESFKTIYKFTSLKTIGLFQDHCIFSTPHLSCEFFQDHLLVDLIQDHYVLSITFSN